MYGSRLAALVAAGAIVAATVVAAAPPASIPAGTVAGTGPSAPPPAAAAVTGMKPTAPLSAADSAKRLHVKDGYAVDLVAAEPMVLDPVAFNWGPDGKLWVVEMADYPYGADGKMKPAGRVRYLVDTDGDGNYDKSVLFASDLNFPTGVLPWRDGVIVTAAPDVLFLADTDGDGKADRRDVLYTGFTEGNPQIRVNSPTYGLDNWVYLANGLSSKGVVRSTQTGKAVNVSGRDVRIRPDTGDIEAEAGPSQFGRRMDDAGDWFGVHNSFPVRHVVLPERYAKRNRDATLPAALSDVGFSANPKVYPRSEGQKRYGAAFFAQSGRFTSACGIALDRDHLLFAPSGTATSSASVASPPAAAPDGHPPARPPTFGRHEHIFTCEPVHNLVQHNVLKPSGTTFAAERAADEESGEFLASEDPWFRPVFAASAPDGTLWVADMYRFMIEHPDWLPAEGKEDYRPYYRLGVDKGRLWRVRPKGATLPLVPAPLVSTRKPRAADAPTREPSGSAADPRGGHTASDLASALGSSSGTVRDQTQATLVWQNDPDAVPLLSAVCEKQDGNPLARMHALCTLDGLHALTPALVERALADPSPEVRRQALRLAEPMAPGSPAVRAAALKLAGDPDWKVRLQFAFSAGEWDGPDVGAALAAVARTAGDDGYLAAAVMTSAGRHYAALADALLKDSHPSAGLLRDLLAMALARRDRDLSAKLLGPTFAAPLDGSAYPAGQFEAFGRFLDLLAQQKTSVRALADRRPGDALSAELAKADGLFIAARDAANAGGGGSRAGGDAGRRVAAVNLLGRDPAAAAADATLLADLYAPGADAAVQLAAVRSLGRLDRPEVPAVLTGKWADRPAAVRSAAADALIAREPWAAALLERVAEGYVPAADFDAARRQRLVRHASARVRALATQAFGDAAEAGRTKVIEGYRPTLSLAGDVTRGQKVFAQNCATCHKVGTEGADVGPNLASVAGWPPDALLTAILDPSRSAEPRYLGFNCTLDTGEVVYGLVLRETPAGVTMKTLDGQERTVPRRQVKALDCTNRSLMPEGLEQAVDPQAMADLIRFLREQPVR
jgi:putative membrane-bound dehydrogenase-like protein